MKILSIDTSGSNCSACIFEDGKIISEFNLSVGITHSQTLLPIIDILNKNANIDISDIDVFACSTGPGSFTGLRIGIATIKGFALSLDKKVIGVPTLYSIANNIPYFDGAICSVLDARNNNVYAAIYDSNLNMVGEYITDTSDKLIETLKKFKVQKIMFVGSGAEVYKEKFTQEFGSNAIFADDSFNRELASSIARVAYKRALNNDFDDCDKLLPMYLKKSQAERMLDGEGSNG